MACLCRILMCSTRARIKRLSVGMDSNTTPTSHIIPISPVAQAGLALEAPQSHPAAPARASLALALATHSPRLSAAAAQAVAMALAAPALSAALAHAAALACPLALPVVMALAAIVLGTEAQGTENRFNNEINLQTSFSFFSV